MSALLAGYFPHLAIRDPKPTPGYVPPRLFDLPEMRPPVQRLEDLTGRPFEDLRVRGLFGRGRYGRTWICDCVCGGERVATTHDLLRGAVVSCGHRLRAPKRPIVMPALPRSRVLWLAEWPRLGARAPRWATILFAKNAHRPLVEVPGGSN